MSDPNEQAIYQRDCPQEAKTMPTFAEGITQEGIQKGIQQGIAAERARRAAPLLEAVTDPDRLAEIGEWILDAEDGETFLRRLEEF